MELIGKPTINPVLFYSGKVAGYITWVVLLLLYIGIDLFNFTVSTYRTYISYFLVIISLFFIILSLIMLGKSVRLGLPEADTVLKTTVVYKISRNPMYVGFNLLTIASIIFSFNIAIFFLGVYSIVVYHLIILGEERFLGKRFGEEFFNYKKKTRRYV